MFDKPVVASNRDLATVEVYSIRPMAKGAMEEWHGSFAQREERDTPITAMSRDVFAGASEWAAMAPVYFLNLIYFGSQGHRATVNSEFTPYSHCGHRSVTIRLLNCRSEAQGERCVARWLVALLTIPLSRID